MGKTFKALADMGDEEFMDSWTSVGQQAEDLKAQLREYSQEHQRRTRKAQLVAQMGDMSEQDLALLQEARAEGIESEEAVHNG